MSAEEEARARLEVAQLYVEMGQAPKAARYYLNAAEIYRDAGLGAKARELFNKVLELDPGNAQAQAELNAMGTGGGAAPPTAPPTAGSPATPSIPPPDLGGGGAILPSDGTPPPGATVGKLQVPTPVIYMRNDQRAAVIAQITTAPDPKAFPFDPLPKVDVNAIAEKLALRKAAEEAEAMKNRTVVESAFSSGGPGFSSGSSSGLLGSANLSSAGGRKKKAPEPEDDSRKSRRRSGNQDLADSIRRRMQGG